MGYSGGSDIFDVVARAVVEISQVGSVPTGTLVHIVASMAVYLHTQDWDVCDEVVEDWRAQPIVLAGLVRSGCVGRHGKGVLGDG